MKRKLLIILFIIFSFLLFAQTPDWQWASQGGGAGFDHGFAITIDTENNTYVTGYFLQTTLFGSHSLTSNGGGDIFVAKLDANGEWQWATQAGGGGYDGGHAITIDSQGNIYVTGYFQETTLFGSHSLTSCGQLDIFVAKLDANGEWEWATQAGGGGYDDGLAITIDTEGSTYVTGYFRQTALFGSFSLTTGSSEFFIAKLDADGEWQWASQANSNSGGNAGYGITIDSEGSIYATGYFQETTSFGSHSLTSNGGGDIFIVKLDTNGNWQWVSQAGGDGSEEGNSITIDSDGSTYVTGIFELAPTFGSHNLTSNGELDIFVAKMNASGEWQWATQAGGNSYDGGHAITIDSENNSYITGHFCETALFGSYSFTSIGDNDIFVAKLDENGDWQWVSQVGSVGLDEGKGLTIDAESNTYVIGSFQQTALFGSNSLTTSGGGDIFVAKLVDIFAIDFNANPITGNAPLDVQFTDLSFGNITIWEWDFQNDGMIDSFLQNPSFTYTEAGVYSVSLTVSNDDYVDTKIKEDFITIISTGVDNEIVPLETVLFNNHPNPFNPTTTISFSIPEESNVELTIFNIKGQKIKSLLSDQITAGKHSIIWNGEDASGKQVSSGVYLYKLKVNDKTEAVKKCLLLK